MMVLVHLNTAASVTCRFLKGMLADQILASWLMYAYRLRCNVQ